MTSPTALRELSSKTDTFARAGEWVGFLDTDREFHLSILAALDNPKLQIVGSLRDQSRLFGPERLAGSTQLLEPQRNMSCCSTPWNPGDRKGRTNHVRPPAACPGLWAGEDETERVYDGSCPAHIP